MKPFIPTSVAIVAWVAGTVSAAAQSPVQKPARWWMDEPIRFLQTNLRERDSAVDPKRLVEQVAEYRCERLSVQHGRDRGAVSHGRGVSLSQQVPSAGAGPVWRSAEGGACAKDPRHRPVRPEQNREAGLRRASGMVLHAHQRSAARVQRALFRVHQRRVLPRARDQDSHRGAGALRGRWAVLQHVRQSVHRLRRQSDGAVPVRPVQGAV